MRSKNLNYQYDPQSLLPKYLQIADALRRWIIMEQPEAGTHFPSDRQIAALCNTTPMTASKAIRELVNRKMVERRCGSGSFIMDNQQTRHEKIGVFSNLTLHPGDSYIDEVISELKIFWNNLGYELIFLMATPRDYERRMFEHNLAGAIVLTPEADYIPQIENLHKCGIPLVSIGFTPANSPDFAFGTDHILFGASAVEYLYNLGHRKISVIGTNSRAEELRKFGYAKGMYQLQLPVNPEWNIHTDKDNWKDKFIQMMRSKDHPTGAIVTHLHTAETVYDLCRQENIAIPEQLSIIGFDHIGQGYNFNPKLTVLAQPVKDFTRAASLKLQQYIQKDAIAEAHEIKRKLILEEGNSCINIKQ